MKNKKAWVRIIEAIIGIMVIMAGILYINSKQPSKDISDDVYEKQRQILEIIANNEDMRTKIIGGETDSVKEYILKTIPSGWDFTINICEVDQICNQNTPNDRDIYTNEIIISSNLTDYPDKKTKKLMFFVWSR
ncbi:MAG: hypothetical protein AABW90_00285 [Nanoarchaeota archaeon]